MRRRANSYLTVFINIFQKRSCARAHERTRLQKPGARDVRRADIHICIVARLAARRRALALTARSRLKSKYRRGSGYD